MRVIGLIQARMSSSRLPGKVLLPLAGKPVLEHVVRRASACPLINDVWVVTSEHPSDEPIQTWCEDHGVPCFRGSLDDVLDRFVKAARASGADAVVRITADCPALDSHILGEVVREFLKDNYDLFGLSGDFPDGLDCSVFRSSALERAWRESSLPSEREHVGPYIEKNPELFKVGGLNYFNDQTLGHHRWTLDEPEDYELLTKIFDALGGDAPFGAPNVLGLLERHPEWIKINAHIARNEGYKKSLLKDKKAEHV